MTKWFFKHAFTLAYVLTCLILFWLFIMISNKDHRIETQQQIIDSLEIEIEDLKIKQGLDSNYNFNHSEIK